MMLCKLWQIKPLTEQTWSSFKTTFQQEHKNLRLLQTTTGSLGYASNLTTDIPPEDDTEDDTGVTDVILALVNAIQEENTSLRTTMTTLTETLKALQGQVTILFRGGQLILPTLEVIKLISRTARHMDVLVIPVT